MQKLTISETAAWLSQEDRFAIVTHRRPDGDTLGSAAALCMGLRQLGKTAYMLHNPEATLRYAHLQEGLSREIICPGDKIVTVHVSDYDFINERHWLPGEGKADFYAMLAALDEVGYKGPWLYEIGLETPKSIERERELALSDFVKNANEIFEGVPLTVLGKSLV